jgi:hypothetical protein
VAAGSGRPVALGGQLGSRRHLGAPRPKLGLPFASPAVANGKVGERPTRTLGMARRLGSRGHLGAPGPELGLPVAVACKKSRGAGRASGCTIVTISLGAMVAYPSGGPEERGVVTVRAATDEMAGTRAAPGAERACRNGLAQRRQRGGRSCGKRHRVEIHPRAGEASATILSPANS